MNDQIAQQMLQVLKQIQEELTALRIEVHRVGTAVAAQK